MQPIDKPARNDKQLKEHTSANSKPFSPSETVIERLYQEHQTLNGAIDGYTRFVRERVEKADLSAGDQFRNIMRGGPSGGQPQHAA